MEYSMYSLLEPRESLWGNDTLGLEKSTETFSYLNFSYYTNNTLFCIDSLVSPHQDLLHVSHISHHCIIHSLPPKTLYLNALHFPCVWAFDFQDLNSWNFSWNLPPRLPDWMRWTSLVCLFHHSNITFTISHHIYCVLKYTLLFLSFTVMALLHSSLHHPNLGKWLTIIDIY